MSDRLLDLAQRMFFIVAGALLLLVIVGGVVRDDWFVSADQKGRFAFSQGRFDDAAKTFADPQWKAAALFRDGDFKGAAGVYSGFDTPESAFNHGNALVMSGQYATAVPRFERALQLRSDWTAAEENLALARAAAKALTFEGGEMTGGKLAADDFVFNKNKNPSGGDEPGTAESSPSSDVEQQAIWLRQVQTQPADFLRSKFAWQQAAREETLP